MHIYRSIIITMIDQDLLDCLVYSLHGSSNNYKSRAPHALIISNIDLLNMAIQKLNT